jgi:hypothetical protein
LPTPTCRATSLWSRVAVVGLAFGSTLPAMLAAFGHDDSRRPLVFSWGVSSFFGWGIYGLNILLTLADHPDYAPFGAVEFTVGGTVLDPLREARGSSPFPSPTNFRIA